MDASETKRDMEPVVPSEIKDLCYRLAVSLDASVYITGGALQDRPVQDYDIIVMSKVPSHKTLDAISYFTFSHCGCTDECTTAASEGMDEKWDGVVQFKWKGLEVDILVPKDGLSIMDILGMYPLSIQKQAWLVAPEHHEHIIRHPDYTEDIIVVYDSGSAYTKYRKYFPDKAFLLLPGVHV
jgi:hypothetical protein